MFRSNAEHQLFYFYKERFCVMSKVLIVGLGNIGDEYASTRHNIGFMVLDTIAKEQSLKFRTDRLADVTEYRFKGKTLILVKPSTYMNLSGKAVN